MRATENLLRGSPDWHDRINQINKWLMTLLSD